MLTIEKNVLVLLLAVFVTVDGHFYSLLARCQYSSEDLHDAVYLQIHRFNKIKFLEYNSTLEKYVGYTEFGIHNANVWNNDQAVMNARKGDLDYFCKTNAETYYEAVYSKTVEPQIEVTSVKESDGSHPARLMCSAYNFYPPQIQVTWLRDGKVVEGSVTSTEELADGDWYYQVHSQLEYTPKSGEEITCVVEHASSKKPFIYKWDPSRPEGGTFKIFFGVLGLVLGFGLLTIGILLPHK